MTAPAALFQRYLSHPWEVALDSNVPKDWWVPFVEQFKENDHSLVQTFRAALHSLSSKKDMWMLRILVAYHPLIALHSLPLLLSRAKGRTLPQQSVILEIETSASTTTTQGSVAHSRPSRTPSPVGERVPERVRSPPGPEQVKRERLIYVQRFEAEQTAFYGMINSRMEDKDHEREYFELVDINPEEVNRIRELEQVLDLVDLMKRQLLLAPESHFQQAIEFVQAALERPEGKAQRQAMQALVIRAGGLIAYWICANPERTRRCLLKDHDDSAEFVTGAFNRVAYYNPGAKRLQFLKSNWMDPTINDRLPEEIKELESSSVKQVDIETKPNFEALYRKACLRPRMVLGLEKEIIKRLTKDEPYHEHFVSLVLNLVYQSPDKVAVVLPSIDKWAHCDRSGRALNDERLQGLWQAVAELNLPQRLGTSA